MIHRGYDRAGTPLHRTLAVGLAVAPAKRRGYDDEATMKGLKTSDRSRAYALLDAKRGAAPVVLHVWAGLR